MVTRKISAFAHNNKWNWSMQGMKTEQNNSEKISVLMSVYRNDIPEHFRLAMESVIYQTVPADEIILTVDGPVSAEMQREIEELQKRCSYLTVFWLKENVGLGNALNYGMQQCKNTIVARMDSDDISVPTRFEKQIQKFKNNSNLTIVGSYIDEFLENPQNPESVRKVPIQNEEIHKKGVIRCPFNHPSVMFRKEHIIDVGGYQEVYLFEDYYLWIRLLEKGYVCENIPQILVHLRVGNGMLNRRCGKKYFSSNKFLQDYMLQHKMISRCQYYFNIVARWCVQVGMPGWMREFVYSKVLRKR